MRFQTNIKIILPLLLVFMIGAGELAGGIRPGMALCLNADPFVPGIDQQQLRHSDEARTRTERAQQPRGRWADPQRRRERLNTLKMWMLTEYLVLSEEQAGKFFPRTQEHQKEKEAIVDQQRKLYEDFQRKIDNGGIEAGDVDRYIAETNRLGKALIDLRTRHLQDLKDILSDEQLAKYAVFDEHFRRRIGQNLREELPPSGTGQSEGEE